MEQYGRNRLQYPRTPKAEVARMRAIERLRNLTRDRDHYLDQAQECSDAIRRIKDEHNITVESREPITASVARAVYRKELHDALDRGMDKGLDEGGDENTGGGKQLVPENVDLTFDEEEAIDEAVAALRESRPTGRWGGGIVTPALVAERIDDILLERCQGSRYDPDCQIEAHAGLSCHMGEDEAKGIGPRPVGADVYHSHRHTPDCRCPDKNENEGWVVERPAPMEYNEEQITDGPDRGTGAL